MIILGNYKLVCLVTYTEKQRKQIYSLQRQVNETDWWVKSRCKNAQHRQGNCGPRSLLPCGSPALHKVWLLRFPWVLEDVSHPLNSSPLCSTLPLIGFCWHLSKRLFTKARGKTRIPWWTCGYWPPYPEARWPYLCAPPVRPGGVASLPALSRCSSLRRSWGEWKLYAFDSSLQQCVKEYSHSKKSK